MNLFFEVDAMCKPVQNKSRNQYRTVHQWAPQLFQVIYVKIFMTISIHNYTSNENSLQYNYSECFLSRYTIILFIVSSLWATWLWQTRKNVILCNGLVWTRISCTLSRNSFVWVKEFHDLLLLVVSLFFFIFHVIENRYSFEFVTFNHWCAKKVKEFLWL